MGTSKRISFALGAWNTPTITGQFEYIERTEWDYPSYYVGPVLRFYNGYALHSTLLYYNGTEYDGRVGVNISHGCVRLHQAILTGLQIQFRSIQEFILQNNIKKQAEISLLFLLAVHIKFSDHFNRF